jgi:hypothetical protein
LLLRRSQRRVVETFELSEPLLDLGNVGLV